ncbi:hypothetical protein DJ83_12520 [Halorubrum ezzemoulense]|uniref:Uncharacterized protein n=1 Tax=Halorubrum ezzemoulense TaxID=337243 RepID=A0A256ISN6_HALEZ|nr:hypothetical protein [Halorubrum ezzemoulense]OYR59580.1 hypothetical protein DJ83_12520 [Halorubrum ezzemoulense]
MIDDILAVLLDIVVASIPDSVWKVLAFVIGATATVAGVVMIDESLWIGGVLITVGVFFVNRISNLVAPMTDTYSS